MSDGESSPQAPTKSDTIPVKEHNRVLRDMEKLEALRLKEAQAANQIKGMLRDSIELIRDIWRHKQHGFKIRASAQAFVEREDVQKMLLELGLRKVVGKK
jgi:hypothetical protein